MFNMLARGKLWIQRLGGVRCLLIVGSCLGYVAQVLAFRDYYSIGRGDGWRELGPGMAIIAFGPVQLSAAISSVLAYVRGSSPSTDHRASQGSDGGYGLDEMPGKLARAERAERAAMWMVGVPGLVMTICMLGELLQLRPPGMSVVAGPGSVLWVPIWAGGVVAAINAMNELEDSTWLFLSALYPVVTLVYARL